MQKPTNVYAEMVLKLRQENWQMRNSIKHFQEILDKNLAHLEEISPQATWEEVEDDGTTFQY
jgi:hypothetical protein